MSEITVVRVVEFGDRAHYQLQWNDPITGRKKTRSSGVERTGKKRERDQAVKAAGELQKKLAEGEAIDASKMTWQQFRDRYDREVLASLAERTAEKVDGVFDALEDIINPQRLRDVTTERLSYFQAELRTKRKLAEATIKPMLAHLIAALRWAKRLGLIVKAPDVDMPKRAGDKMKGRPIVGEEFDRMLAKAEAGIVLASDTKAAQRARKRPAKPVDLDVAAHSRKRLEKQAATVAASWRHYLRGMWLSGLRLTESLDLWWDRDDKLCIDLSGKRPMLRIPAALEKGNKDRLLPLAPEFAEFLLATPADQRTGPVFTPGIQRKRTARLSPGRVCFIVSKIGEAAGVKVSTQRGGQPKYASAHDLRRSFGERWALRVMPQVLMELMRHESITTTMKFYVGRNAERTADVLWAIHDKAATGNTSGNSGSPVVHQEETAADATSDFQTT